MTNRKRCAGPLGWAGAIIEKDALMNQFTISFGCMSHPISEQLNQQGLALAPGCQNVQRLADALIDLMMGDILAPSACDAARKKLMKKIKVVPLSNDASGGGA